MSSSLLKAPVVGALLAALFTLPAVAQPQTLIFCSEGSPEGFNPQLYISGTTFDASSRQVYNRLVEFERGTTTIRPALAERWEVTDDGLQYTFRLRKGVAFHSTQGFKPTREFNADDVLFSFNRQWDPEHPYHPVSGGTYEYFNGMGMPELLVAIDKLDDHTVRFTLNHPEAPLIANMAMDFASILSAEYAEQLLKTGNPEQLDLQPIGTGPFQLLAYQQDAVIRYQAHPNYWEGKAPLDNLVFSITPDAAVRYAKLRAGECHVMSYPNPADVDSMQRNRAINVLEKEGLNVGYLAFNTQKKPFDDQRVRQALNIAVNKQAIMDTIFQGTGRIAKNPIPPTIWSYNDEVQDYPYHPEAAKELLAKAGYPDGFETDLWAMPVQRPYNPNARRMAEMIQADWALIGVTARIVSYEWGEYLRRTKDGEHQTVLLGWTGDNGDPDNFLSVLLSCDAVGGANRAQWCHEPFEALIREARRISDPAQRAKRYREAQVIFKEEAPWITIAHSVVFQPVRREVKDFRIDPFGGHLFYGVELTP